jgi:hypothetical protein
VRSLLAPSIGLAGFLAVAQSASDFAPADDCYELVCHGAPVRGVLLAIAGAACLLTALVVAARG